MDVSGHSPPKPTHDPPPNPACPNGDPSRIPPSPERHTIDLALCKASSSQPRRSSAQSSEAQRIWLGWWNATEDPNTCNVFCMFLAPVSLHQNMPQVSGKKENWEGVAMLAFILRLQVHAAPPNKTQSSNSQNSTSQGRPHRPQDIARRTRRGPSRRRGRRCSPPRVRGVHPPPCGSRRGAAPLLFALLFEAWVSQNPNPHPQAEGDTPEPQNPQQVICVWFLGFSLSGQEKLIDPLGYSHLYYTVHKRTKTYPIYIYIYRYIQYVWKVAIRRPPTRFVCPTVKGCWPPALMLPLHLCLARQRAEHAQTQEPKECGLLQVEIAP